MLDMTTDEKAMVGLVRSYLDSIIHGKEIIQFDPDPKLENANEQYHIWYWPSGLKGWKTAQYLVSFEMIGWFRVCDSKIDLTIVKKFPWTEFRKGRWPSTKAYEFDLANPDPADLKKLLRDTLNKAKKHLILEAKRDR